MDISKTQYKRCDVIKTSGRISSLNAPELERAFGAITEGRKYGIVFDMSEIEFISSRGLWVLLDTQKTCKKSGGELVLVNVSENIQSSFELAGMEHFFTFYDEILSAVGSF
jgi:anti-sigma B factor antagonist